MRILIRSIFIGLVLLIFLAEFEANAQPRKARERIQQMKKLKLLDVLKLSEEEADKFIIKYNSWENKIDDQKEIVDDVSDDLFEALQDDKPNEELQKLSQKLFTEQEKFFSLQIEKLKAMKDVLNEKNYAKYLVFEDRFIKELGKMLWQRGGDGEGGPPGGGRRRR